MLVVVIIYNLLLGLKIWSGSGLVLFRPALLVHVSEGGKVTVAPAWIGTCMTKVFDYELSFKENNTLYHFIPCKVSLL